MVGEFFEVGDGGGVCVLCEVFVVLGGRDLVIVFVGD